ncbi:MAG: sterol desaturase family protein [Myxococcales bacterium]|nr:sterol desaturase family protein [Myxococcales bacterium]
MSIDTTLELFVTWGVVATYLGLIALDLFRPARAYPHVRGWRAIGVASFVMFNAIGMTAPFLWDELLATHRLVDLSALPFGAQALVGLLAYELLGYGWHRLLHGVPALWRIHQTHHAAERVDVFGAFFFHPLGALGWTLITSLALVWMVGLVPEAALVAATVTGILATFQHANLRTPRWLGYLIARPEMHALHHARGVHRHNYGDIALFDMIFGTWQNPASVDGVEAGLVDGGSLRLTDLLLGRDLLAERAPADEKNEARPSRVPAT